MTDTDIGKLKVEDDFESIGLHPGATMQIQSFADGSQTHHWVKYIGFIKDSSVLTTLPFKYGKGMWIQSGETFIVRGFDGKHAYAFTAQMICARAHPFPYIHFAWPDSIDMRIVRKAPRIEVSLPVNVSLSDNTSVETVLHDVSISGVMLDSSAELGKIGDLVRTELSVNLEGNPVTVKVQAIIRNVHHQEDGEGYKTGLEFSDISQNERLILNYFIDTVPHAG